MTSGTFPSSQKQVSVTAALKNSALDPYDLGLLIRSCSSELHTTRSWVTHRTNHLLPKYRSAYQGHGSTETATLEVLSDVYQAADIGKITLLEMLDLSAAFDTVNHQILLNRLRHSFGIRGTVLLLQWIASNLTWFLH